MAKKDGIQYNVGDILYSTENWDDSLNVVSFEITEIKGNKLLGKCMVRDSLCLNYPMHMWIHDPVEAMITKMRNYGAI